MTARVTRATEHPLRRPGVGEFVRLPIGLPPTLVRAIGYGGEARYLALSWTRDHRRVDWFDSELGLTGDGESWRAFADHASVRPLLTRYEVGDGDASSQYLLLVDRWEDSLSVGRWADVQALVESQPSALHADAQARGGRDDDLLEAIVARLQAGQPSGSDDRARRRQRRAELAVDAARWLDAAAGGSA
jgi:hypothetical protein